MVLSVVGKNTPPLSLVVVVWEACDPAPVIMALLASDDSLVTSVPGRSAIPNEHGANAVDEPQVPMTWWEVWPVAAPSVNVEPEIVQVSQFAPGLEQEVAPLGGGGKACAWPTWANQTARRAHKRKRAILQPLSPVSPLDTCQRVAT